MAEQEVLSFVKKHNSDPECNSCDDCVFRDVCCETQELEYVLGKCYQGDYWEIESREQREV